MLAFVVAAKQRVNVIDLVSRRASEIERLDRFAEVICQGAVLGAAALGAGDAAMAAMIFSICRIRRKALFVSGRFEGALSFEVVFRPLKRSLSVSRYSFSGLLLCNLSPRWIGPKAFPILSLVLRVLRSPFLAQRSVAAGVLRPPLLEIGRSTFTALSIPANRPSLVVKSVSALRAPKQKRPPVKLAPAWEGLADKLPEVKQRFT